MTPVEGATATWLAIIMATVFAAMILATARLLRGPSLADRVLALDLLAASGVAFVALLAWRTGNVVYLDVAVAVAMVSFLGAIALASYLETRGDP